MYIQLVFSICNKSIKNTYGAHKFVKLGPPIGHSVTPTTAHNVPVKLKLKHPPPATPWAFEFFGKFLFKFPPPEAKELFKCPIVGPFQVIKCPHPQETFQ